MKRIMKLVLVIGLSMVIGIAVYRLWSVTPEAARERLPVQSASSLEIPGAQRTRVTALGRLTPRGEVINVSAPEGDRLAQLLVIEGQQVQVGDILATLDSHAERVAERQHIASRLAESSARLVAETTYGKAIVAESSLRIQQLERLPPLDIQIQEAKVHSLEAEVTTAQKDMERLHHLDAKNAVAQQEVDRQKLVLSRNQLELQGARSALQKLHDANALDVQLARAQLHTAQASLLKAQSAMEVESLRAQLALAAVRVERCLIRAPISGQILKILSRPGEMTGKQTIAQMGDTAHMYAVAEVYETDISLVRVGQPASVTSPALPQALHGVVD